MAKKSAQNAKEAIANRLFTINSMLSLLRDDRPVYELESIVDSLHTLTATTTQKILFEPSSQAALRVQLRTDAVIDWYKLVDVFGILHQHSLFRMRAVYKKQIAFQFTRLENICGDMDEVDAANFLLELFKRINNKRKDVFPGLVQAAERRLVTLRGNYLVNNLVALASPRRYTNDEYEMDEAVTRVQKAIEERDLKQKVEELERATAVEPPTVQTVFKVEGLEDYPKVVEFLDSDRMYYYLEGFNSIVKPRKIVNLLAKKLGDGFVCEAQGKGKTSSVYIRKPKMEEYRVRDKYLEKVKSLAKAREELRRARGETGDTNTERKRLRDVTNENGLTSPSTETKRIRVDEENQEVFACEEADSSL